MPIRQTLRFTLQAITVGLALAFVLLVLKPELISGQRPSVQVSERSQPALAPAATGPVSYSDAVMRSKPAVVNIHTAKIITERVSPLFSDPLFKQLFGDAFGVPRQRLETSLGSGVIASEQGYVLTNNHVIEGASEIRVQLNDGRVTPAQLVGADPDTDLAVLKIDLPALPTIVLGSSKALHIGDIVLAIGNPYGVGQTVTMGIVSATGRSQLGISTFENFIQTDAAINPGNSGGALVNAIGDLVGINTAIFSRSGGSQGIGFAIPVDLASHVMRQIIEHGRVIRGWIGVQAQDLNPELATLFGLEQPTGFLIAGIYRGSPADLAGLRPGDVITQVAGHPVNNAAEGMNRVAQVDPGTELELAGLREREPTRWQITTIASPTPRP